MPGRDSNVARRRTSAGMACVFLAVPIAGMSQQPTVRDSAGITIIENGLINASTAFAVSEKPECLIRGNSGNADTDLTIVPSAFRLSDKSIVMAEARSRTVRVYRCDGTLTKKIGRPGSGPAEFQNLAAAWRWRGDSILVSQLQSGSLVVLHAQNGFVRTIPLRGNITCCFADGSVLLSRVLGEDRVARNSQDEVRRTPIAFEHVALTTEARSRGEVLVVPGNETLGESKASAARSGDVTVTRRTIRAAPFGRLTSVRPLSASIVVGEGNAFELRLLSPGGQLKRIIRATYSPVRLTPSEIRHYKSEQLRNLEGQARDRAAKELESTPFPPQLPAYRRVDVDERGRIWVEQYRRPTESIETWIVFDQDGNLKGKVLLPRDSRVLWFGPDEVILRRTDEDGFVNISTHRLRLP